MRQKALLTVKNNTQTTLQYLCSTHSDQLFFPYTTHIYTSSLPFCHMHAPSPLSIEIRVYLSSET